MNFDPYNRLLKIRESIETPTPKVGAHLGVCGFIPSHSQGHEMWLPGSFLARTFASPYFSRKLKGYGRDITNYKNDKKHYIRLVDKLIGCLLTGSLYNTLVEQVTKQVVKQGVVLKFLGLLIKYQLMIV
jgi:hypothetical protein